MPPAVATREEKRPWPREWPTKKDRKSGRRPTQARRFSTRAVEYSIRQAESASVEFARSESPIADKVALLRAISEASNSFGAIREALKVQLTPYVSLSNKFEDISLASAYKAGTIKTQAITSNPKVLNGKPCVKDTRIPVALVLRYLAVGDDPVEDLNLKKEDVEACLAFAASVCDQGVYPDA